MTISPLLREINAVCDFILEASDWAKNLVLLPEEQRGPLFGLPVTIINVDDIIINNINNNNINIINIIIIVINIMVMIH